MSLDSPAHTMSSEVVRPRSGLMQIWVFAAVAMIEVVIASYLSDTPKLAGTGSWQPMLAANAVAKVAIVAVCLLFVAAWPRRHDIARLFRASSQNHGLKYYLAANIILFLTLLDFRAAAADLPDPSVSVQVAYCALLFATGASLAAIAAPPLFWWRLPRVVPAELAIAVGGGVLVFWLGNVVQQGWSWSGLSGATLAVSHWMLTLYESNVVLDADRLLLGVGQFSVHIDGSCSGYEGIALVLIFFPVYMWVFRDELKFPNVLLLLPLGILAIWLLNSIRIAALVSIGAHLSPAVAAQGFHSQAGWISFLIVTLSTVAVARRAAMFAKPEPRDPASAFARPDKAASDLSLAYLAPFIGLVGAAIVASAFVPHDQWLYGLKVLAIAAALWRFRDVYTPLVRSVSWVSVVIGLAVGGLWVATDPSLGDAAPLGLWIASLPLWLAAAWLAMRALGSVVLVPIAEELAFRGFLARWLVSTRFETVGFDQFRFVAFAGSSLAFGLLHERWLAATLAGAVYALVMYRTNRLSDPIAAHAASNFVIIGAAIVFQAWALL